jgi:hypothetical protein
MEQMAYIKNINKMCNNIKLILKKKNMCVLYFVLQLKDPFGMIMSSNKFVQECINTIKNGLFDYVWG